MDAEVQPEHAAVDGRHVEQRAAEVKRPVGSFDAASNFEGATPLAGRLWLSTGEADERADAGVLGQAEADLNVGARTNGVICCANPDATCAEIYNATGDVVTKVALDAAEVRRMRQLVSAVPTAVLGTGAGRNRGGSGLGGHGNVVDGLWNPHQRMRGQSMYRPSAA